MAVQRGDGEDGQVREAEGKVHAGEEIHHRQADQRRRDQSRQDAVRDDGAAGKGMDERGQIDDEGDDPEQRHRGDVRREVPCEPQEQRAGHRCQRQDPDDRKHRRTVRCNGHRRQDGTAAGQAQPQDHQQGGQAQQHQAPDPRLVVQADEGLQQERVREQGTGGTRVGRRVEEVGVLGRPARARARQPGLHQWRQGGGGDEGEAEGSGHGPEEPQGRWQIAGRITKQAEVADGCHEGRPEPEAGDHGQLTGHGHVPGKHVGKRVAGEERGLEEHHGGVPGRG